MSTGDQAGFGLGTLLVIAWFMPIAGALLLFGLATLRFDGSLFLVRSVIAWTLRLGAIWFLAFTGFELWANSAGSPPSKWASELLSGLPYTLEMLAFPATLWVCARALSFTGGPALMERRWLVNAVAVITLALPWSVIGIQFSGAYAIYMGWPMFLWPLAGVVAWRSLRRGRALEAPPAI
jgi:hypothetical protein